MPALVDAHEAGAAAELLPVQADQLRAAERAAPSQGQERCIAAADVERRVEHGQQVAHVGSQERRGLPLDLGHGLHARDPAPHHGDRAVFAVEGVAGEAVGQCHRGQGLVDRRPRQGAPAVLAVGERGQPRGDGLGRGRQGLPAVTLAPAGKGALPAAVGLARGLGEGLGHVVLGPLDQLGGQRDLAAVGRQRDQRGVCHVVHRLHVPWVR